MNAEDDEENTPTNSPLFEPKGLSSFADWSQSKNRPSVTTRQSDTALLQGAQSEEDARTTLRSKSVPSITNSPVAQSSDVILQSKQDGDREKDDDTCLFELSDTEGSGNNCGATAGGVASTSERVGGRPANQIDEELVCVQVDVPPVHLWLPWATNCFVVQMGSRLVQTCVM